MTRVNLKVSIKYKMIKKLHLRLDNYTDKLIGKYERISNLTNNGIKSPKPLRVIGNILGNIETVQTFFIEKLEHIEKRTGRDLTIFDSALDKLEGLEDKLAELKKQITKLLRKRRTEHRLTRVDGGIIRCGF